MSLDNLIQGGMKRMRESIGKLDYDVQRGTITKALFSNRRYIESYLNEYLEIDVWKRRNSYIPMEKRYANKKQISKEE